jgi:hypothetical protein
MCGPIPLLPQYAFKAWCSVKKHRDNFILPFCYLKKEEVTGCWRKLHTEEFHILYFSSNFIRVIKPRRMKWMGHIAHMEEMRNAYEILVRKPEGRRPHGRPKHTCEDSIKMTLKQMWFEAVDWIKLAQYRLQWQVLW